LLVTVVQMLLGLINLGSSSAFTAFVSVGVQALAASYGMFSEHSRGTNDS
jgi:hypothetical protein